jgi:hypothetical protein
MDIIRPLWHVGFEPTGDFETKEAAEIPVIGPSASSEGVHHQFRFSVHGFALAI